MNPANDETWRARVHRAAANRLAEGAALHFAAMMRVLDRQMPGYAE